MNQQLWNPTDADAIDRLRDEIAETFQGYSSQVFEPTGVQEEIIRTVGCGKFEIVLCLHNNKGGKTATAVNILKNIFWEPDKNWFAYLQYERWPFESKQGRITGTPRNTADNGPIRKEIKKWWPDRRWHAEKAGKKYYSEYTTDSGFEFDVLTYEMDPEEYEGPFLSWTWSDEPPHERLVGPITSRFAGGGIWLITATPIQCGPFLSVIKDLKDRGKRVITLNAKLSDFCKERGKPNHKGTKRGLWSWEQMTDYIAGIPIDEYDARVLGKADAKSGMIYSMFNRNVHVKDVDICSPYYKASNCFCSMDPHKKGYPAISWWMLTPSNDLLCYNEWPTRDFLGGYYDEARANVTCDYSIEEIARFIKILDGTQFGLTIRERAMDPRFGRATEGEYGRRTDSLMQQYARYKLDFQLPRVEQIDVQRERIRALLQYDPQMPIGEANRPRLYVMPHCENMIRCLERHYWAEPRRGQATEYEAERYKDFIDTLRYLLALLGELKYIDPSKKAVEHEIDMSLPPYPMHDIALA